METLRESVKDLLIPGSFPFLILGLLLGVPSLFGSRRTARWGRNWLAALLVLYSVLSLPIVSDLLVFGLSRGYAPLRSPADAREAEVVVVLGNGISAYGTDDQVLGVAGVESGYNALEAARIYRLLGDPLVLTSGGKSDPKGLVPESEVLAAALRQLGVPDGRIAQESTSLTTLEQVATVERWLRERGTSRFVLVTTGRAAGVDF